MKKLLMAVLALCLVFCLVQVTVADDRLKVSGSIALKGNYRDNNDSEDTDSDSNVDKYMASSMRLGMVFNVAEGITGNLRMDLSDWATWGGSDIGTSGRVGDYGSDEGAELEIDRMFIRIERDMFIFQGGQIFQGFGEFTTYAMQGRGLALRLKLPVVIDLNYFKLNENASNEDEADDQKDHNIYALQGTYKADMFTIGGYYAMDQNVEQADYSGSRWDSKNVLGVFGKTKIGPVALAAAIDILGGKVDDDTDFMGTQAFVHGEMAATEALTIGANIYYAMGTDDDDKVQITRLSEAGGPGDSRNYIQNVPFDKYLYGAMGRFAPDIGGMPGFPTPYEYSSAQNAGMTAFDVFGKFKATPKLLLALQAGYFMPQNDDEDIADWNSTVLLQGSATWSFAKKCQLFGGVYHRTEDRDEDDPDAALGATAVLKINW